MNLTQKVAFTLVELFETQDESLMRVAGDAPVLMVGSCCCCNCETIIVEPEPVSE